MKNLSLINFISSINPLEAIKIDHPPFGKGRCGGIFPLMNSKGISVLFLVIAMLLIVTIGYVFSYLIPTKQKSIAFSIYSNQAFFISHSGVEFAIRYASDNNWGTPAQLNNLNGMTRNLGNGQFTLAYDSVNDRLTSSGNVQNIGQRRIIISNFTSFLSQALILAPGYQVPCWCLGTRRTRFFIQNVGGADITINAFSATWNQVGQPRTITRIDVGITPPLTQKYAGNYANGAPFVNFNQGGNSQTITPNQVIEVVVYWSGNTNGINIVINFRTSGGAIYTFTLDPGGGGLGSCPHPC